MDDAAAAMADLILAPAPADRDVAQPLVFHIENPIRQSWEDVLDIIGNELSLPSESRLSYSQWIDKVFAHPDDQIEENPAKKMEAFFQGDFEHMSGGQVVMSTDRSRACSDTLRVSRPVGDDLVKAYVAGWRETGFLK